MLAMLPLLFTLLLATQTSAATPIAGEYYQGDGLGLNWTLTLKEDHTFTFVWVGCVGEYGNAAGQWSEESGAVNLWLTAVHDSGDRLPLSYSIVRWGERVYLVPPEEFPRFCSGVVQGWEPREDDHGEFFLRMGYSDRKPAGKPSLPVSYRSFLLEAPVRAKIVSVDGGKATINAGARQRLLPGMLLYGQNDDMSGLQIVSVSPDSAVVKCLPYSKMPPEGTNVSTLLTDPQFYPKQ